jgi:nucleoside-diphosphate-sugar epimerase
VTRLAILGATSQIARDLAANLAADADLELALFARRPEAVTPWVAGLGDKVSAQGYEKFDDGAYDVIINFVGAGDPARVAQMGADIFDVTLRYDNMALDYLRRHDRCRYLFLSSGAVFGSSFLEPVDEHTPALIAVNALASRDFYGAAKLHAECRHRALADQAIVDIRMFNYVSRTQDLAARFFISDIFRSIRDHKVLTTTDQPMVRDFVHPQDFQALVTCLMRGKRANLAADCFSRAPVDKATLLAAMSDRFGLNYKTEASPVAVDATGAKPNYYSLNRRAAEFGYAPSRTSLEAVIEEASAIFGC